MCRRSYLKRDSAGSAGAFGNGPRHIPGESRVCPEQVDLLDYSAMMRVMVHVCLVLATFSAYGQSSNEPTGSILRNGPG
jgi:hypothetical protein